MKKRSHFILILIVLFTNNICGQTIFINELAEAKKLPPSTKKDSVIVDLLYQLTQIPSKNAEKWRDSLKIYADEYENRIAQLLSSFGNSDVNINQYELLSTANELEKLQYFAYASWAYLRVGAAYTYYFREKYEQKKALPYYEKALQLAQLTESESDIIRVYDYIGEHYLTIGDFKKGIYYLKLAEKMLLINKNQSLLPTVYSSLASCNLQINNTKLAQEYYRLATNKLQSPIYNFAVGYQIYVGHIYLGNASSFFLKRKEFKKSLNYGLKGISTIEAFTKMFGVRSDFENYELNFLETIHETYFGLGDFENAYKYFQKFEQIKNSKNKNAQINDFNELNLKYQTDQNKLKITALENESLKKEAEKQSTLKYFGTAIISLLLLIISSIFYANNNLKKKNKEISEAMLKGQTTERKRVASDLHDNLGSTMSSIRWAFQAIDRTKWSDDEKEIFSNVQIMFDKAYDDIRLLSHNLLPEEFERLGLTTILQNFIRKINKNTTIRFDLKVDEEFGRVDKKIEFELYSICLELVNNIMKHSKATEATIKLSRTNKQIKLIVADNGIGIFKNESDGKGVKNVQARVESLNGTWKIQNIENEGLANEILIPV